jgi:hypothetical protein
MLRIGIGSDILNTYVAMINSSTTAEVLCNTQQYHSMIRTSVVPVVRVYEQRRPLAVLSQGQLEPRRLHFQHLETALTHSALAAQDDR